MAQSKKRRLATSATIEIASTPDIQIRGSIGKKLRRLREARSQSAERVAKKLGISRVALTHIENGRNNVNAIQLWKLACILGCDITEFFPPIPDGFSLTHNDYEKIAREDERAAGWAHELFD